MNMNIQVTGTISARVKRVTCGIARRVVSCRVSVCTSHQPYASTCRLILFYNKLVSYKTIHKIIFVSLNTDRSSLRSASTPPAAPCDDVTFKKLSRRFIKGSKSRIFYSTFPQNFRVPPVKEILIQFALQREF